jgi:hypothetical protein
MSAEGREREFAVAVHAWDGTRPKAVLAHIGMLARKRPFAACGNLTLMLACLAAAQGVQDVFPICGD